MIEKTELIENLLKIGNYKKMFRVKHNGARWYLSDEKEGIKLYSGLTNAMSASTFKGDPDVIRLKNWRESMVDSYGSKNVNDYIDFTADFGTLLHECLVTIKENGKLVWKEEFENAVEYFINAYKEKHLVPDYKLINKMAYEYQKHAGSLMQFIYERVQEIYAVETIVCNDKLKIATPVDMVCLCRQTPKGEPQRTVINIKTSNQVTQHYLEQVSCELAMWNQNYDKAYFAAILRTKNWNETKIPTYDYKYLSIEEAQPLSHECFSRMLLCLNSKASYYYDPSMNVFEGETKAGQQPIIKTKSLQDEWTEFKKAKG